MTLVLRVARLFLSWFGRPSRSRNHERAGTAAAVAHLPSVGPDGRRPTRSGGDRHAPARPPITARNFPAVTPLRLSGRRSVRTVPAFGDTGVSCGAADRRYPDPFPFADT